MRFLCFPLVPILILCSAAGKAESQTHPEYGTVIGIGMYLSDTASPKVTELDLGTT